MTAADERIVELFEGGYGLDYISEQGLHGGWSRMDALRVASERSWQLDKSGRIPRDQRKAPRPPAVMRPGRVLCERPTPRPTPHRPQPAAATTPVPPQVVVAVPTPAADPFLQTLDEVHELINATPEQAEALHQTAVDLAPLDLLARGLTHPSPSVRKLAREAQAAVDQLVTALHRRTA